MRNLAYFFAAFVIVCVLGFFTGCSMPLRKPEPYEQRTSSVDLKKQPKPPVRQANYYRNLYPDPEYAEWAMRKEREHDEWYDCIRRKRLEEC